MDKAASKAVVRPRAVSRIHALIGLSMLAASVVLLLGCGSSGPQYLHGMDSCSTYLEASRAVRLKWTGTEHAEVRPTEKYCEIHPDVPLYEVRSKVGPERLTPTMWCVESWPRASEMVKLSYLEETIRPRGQSQQAYESALRDLGPVISAFCAVQPKWTLREAQALATFAYFEHREAVEAEVKRIDSESFPVPGPLTR